MTIQSYQPSLDPLLDKAKHLAEHLRRKGDTHLVFYKVTSPHSTSMRFRKLLLTQLSGLHQGMTETDLDYVTRMRDHLENKGWEIRDMGSSDHIRRKHLRTMKDGLDRESDRRKHHWGVCNAINDAFDTDEAA
jgi:hypothetical protein